MKFAVTKEALLEGLQRILNVVSSRATLPVLNNTLIETTETGLRLTTTDLDVAIRCDVPAQIEKPGATTLQARRFAAIVRELVSSEIVCETDSKHITALTCGTSVFKLFGLPKEDFPKFPDLPDAKIYTLKQAELKDGLRKTAYAISLDETRYVLNGILFSFTENKLTLVATDGRRLALFDSDIEFPQSQERNFIVPTKAVTELQRILTEEGDVQIVAGANQIVFRIPGAELAAKLVEGNYPNYRQVVPGEAKERITLEREPLLEYVRRVFTLNSDANNPLRLSFGKNRLDISMTIAEVGEASESMAINYRGREFSIAFNAQYLMDPLRNLLDPEIHLELIDEISPGVIKINKPFLYVLMPMRVSV